MANNPLFPIPGMTPPPIQPTSSTYSEYQPRQSKGHVPPSLSQLRQGPSGTAGNAGTAGPGRSNDHWIEAKTMYMDYLRDILVPIVYDTMQSVYMDAVNMTEGKRHEDIEKTFMDFLVETKVWSIPIIKGETQNILNLCQDFATILKSVFVSNVMVLSSAQLNRPDAPTGKVRLNIPQCEVFVQALYANVAARLFNHPNIFRTKGLTSDQIIDNRNLAHDEIRQAINSTVRSLIPFREVIESSMNFKGNNPVITARPQYQQRQRSTRPGPPALRAHGGWKDPKVPEGPGRISDRTIVGGQSSLQAQQLNTSSNETVPPRTQKTPDVPTAKKSALQRRSNILERKPQIEQKMAKEKLSARLRQNEFEQSTSKNKDKRPPSKISFRPPPQMARKIVKKRISPKAPRRSEFRERTGSGAIRDAVSKLNIDEDSYRNMTSSSSSSSSTSEPELSETYTYSFQSMSNEDEQNSSYGSSSSESEHSDEDGYDYESVSFD